MKKITLFILFLITLIGCGSKVDENKELIDEMKLIAVNHINSEYNVELIVDSYKLFPKQANSGITFNGHSKEKPSTEYTVTVDYLEKK